MNRCMGKLKGWEMNRWLEDERLSEWEEGGQSVSPPLCRQGEILETELVSCYYLVRFLLTVKGCA